MPERESRGEMMKTRKRAEKLVEVTPEYPEKLPKRIAAIIKRFEPFEDLALASDHSETAALDLNDLMEMEGVLGQELVTMIEGGGRMLRAFTVAAEKKIITFSTRSQGGMDYYEVIPDSVQRFQRFVSRMDKNTEDIVNRLQTDSRPLAARFVVEMTRYSFLLSVAEKVLREGLEEVVERKRAEMAVQPEQEGVFSSVILARLLQSDNNVTPSPYTHSEAFELLRDGAYAPTPDSGITIDLPCVRCFGQPVRGRIRTFAPQSPLALGILSILNPTNNEVMAELLLSRITGELIPATMSVVSAEAAYAAFSNTATYTLLRNAAFAGFVEAIDAGKITEEPYVSFNKDEVERLTYRQPKVRSGAAVAPATSVTPSRIESAPALPNLERFETQSVALPKAIENVSVAPRVLSVAEQIAEMNKPREKKDARVIWYESRISWRRTTRALRRLGVSVELKAHTKLQLGTRKTDYLNPHDTDPQHCKRELFRVLDDLGIDYDAFFAVLK